MTIETARLSLVGMSIPFIEAMLAGDRAGAERTCGAALAEGWPPDIVQERALPITLHRLRGDPALAPWLGHLMILRANRSLIGMLGFKGGPDERGSIEIGWGVQPAFEGQGYTTEAAQALFEWAVQQPGVRHIIAQIPPDNAASRRVAAKLGMEPSRTSEHPDVGTVDIWQISASSVAPTRAYH